MDQRRRRSHSAGEPRSFQQALSTVKKLTSSGRLDYNPNLRTHINAVKSIADVADNIPPGPRQQISDRIDRISIESEISVPGYQTPLGTSVAGYYQPGTHALHVSTDSGDTSHVVMHEMIHALDNNLQGGHRFSSRRDWLALCRSIWASEYAKTHARSYFVPSGPADMARAAKETFAELLACHFEGKPLSLTSPVRRQAAAGAGTQGPRLLLRPIRSRTGHEQPGCCYWARAAVIILRWTYAR